MKAYMGSRDCLMRFLAEELSDPHAGACGKCVNCAGRLLPEQFPEELIRTAINFLESRDTRIEPRQQWPPGLPEPDVRGKIRPECKVEEGRALCHWGDAAFGEPVRAGKQHTGTFDDRLVEAACRLISDRWNPRPAPRWVTCVPSRRLPTLVPEFARRLAARLGLPLVDCISKVRDTEAQKTRANSFQQVSNLIGAFQVQAADVRPTPVLLVDDLVDSRWTFTVVGALLRQAGSGPVYPFALADSSGQDSD